jgi:hypothetical protein
MWAYTLVISASCRAGTADFSETLARRSTFKQVERRLAIYQWPQDAHCLFLGLLVCAKTSSGEQEEQ